MRREIIDSMNSDGFEEFFAACDELRNCKYVIAESKIAALLKAIADDRQIYALFASALKGFDYNKVFYECVSASDRMFVLPNDYKNAIALVFRILLDMDNGKIKLESFLEAYYSPGSVNEEYARFGLEVIAPFSAYCKMYFAHNADSADMSLIELAPARRQGNNSNLPPQSQNDRIDDTLKKDALDCIIQLTDIGNDSINNFADRREYSVCLDGLSRALRSYSYDDIVSAFIGVKYAVLYFFSAMPDILAVYKKLEYDIKHLSNR